MILTRLLAGMTLALFFTATAAHGLPAASANNDYYDDGAPQARKVELGRLLFFDKVLSGNRNISCATCHHPFAGTADGLSLPVGEGARGTGITRDTGLGPSAVHERVPRNAPAIFNLGAREFTVLFHDGRVQPDPNSPSGIASPAGLSLPDGLDNALAVQAMFPVTSATEMAGQPGENPVGDAAGAGNLAGPGGVWSQLAERLRGIDDYAAFFVEVFNDVHTPADIRFVHAANAIAAFEAVAWRSDNSPFDRLLTGERGAISARQKRGMQLFYGKAGCSECHSGRFQTDHSFRAIAMPAVGPGKGDGPSGHDDFGRERVTGNPSDRYRFRVPSLRNVVLTAPYGHSGAYNSLEDVVRHHLDPVASLLTYDPRQAVLPQRPDLEIYDSYAAHDQAMKAAIAAANELAPRTLRDREFESLLDFLHALTDPAMLDLRRDVPAAVPSGLPVAD